MSDAYENAAAVETAGAVLDVAMSHPHPSVSIGQPTGATCERMIRAFAPSVAADARAILEDFAKADPIIATALRASR